MTRSPDEQDVAVGIGDLEAAHAVVGIMERRAECRSRIGEFGGERVGIRD
jgi:hypothetical protein